MIGSTAEAASQTRQHVLSPRPPHTRAASLFRRISAAFLLWFVIAVVYVKSPIIYSTDSKWVILQSVSLIRHGDFTLDEYRHSFRPGDFSVHGAGGHWYSLYPAGVPVLTTPIVWIATSLAGIDLIGDESARIATELVAASMITATAAMMVYAFCCASTRNHTLAVIASVVFAFGTAAWSTASRSLWQHGPSMLLVSAAIYALFRSERSLKWLVVCGFCVAAAYTVRPTNWVVVVGVTIYVCWRFRARGLWRYICAATPIAVAFVAYNFAVYGLPLTPYYMGYTLREADAWVSWRGAYPDPAAMVGHLFSPGRGLFVYSPVFLIVVWSVWKRIKQGSMQPIDWLALFAVSAHWLLISVPVTWWGGHCYGARLFSDAMPWLMLLLVHEVASWTARSPRFAALAVLALASVIVNYVGATSVPANAWNWTPTNIDTDVARVWMWNDLPFLRK